MIAKGYNELYEDEQLNKLNLISKHLKVNKNDKLLDVGCGTGVSTTYFDCDTIGVDPCTEMLNLGQGELKTASAEDLPFANESFDIVISITAIHNFKDYSKGLIEIKRVLKKNGKVALTVLKKSAKFEDICKEIKSLFDVIELNEDKDRIFVSK